MPIVMKASADNFDLARRRSAARRTAWIVAIVAALIFVLSFAQALSH
jgi:CHASE3 domain sensor protein